MRGGFMATIKREKFMAIQKVKNFGKDFGKDLSERQKGIVSRLFETGQKIVLDDVLKDALENLLKDVPKDVLENALENALHNYIK